MSNYRTAIVEFFSQGKRQYDIFRLLNVPQQTVSNTIRRFKQFGYESRRP